MCLAVNIVEIFLNLLGSGREMNIRLSYEIQDEAGGIAQALSLCERFVGTSNVAVCLGDNIFDDELGVGDLEDFDGGARIFLKSVPGPRKDLELQKSEKEIGVK